LLGRANLRTEILETLIMRLISFSFGSVFFFFFGAKRKEKENEQNKKLFCLFAFLCTSKK